MTSRSSDNFSTRRGFLRTIGVVGVALATGTLAACGGSAKSKTIRMTAEMKFEPATLTVRKGETVTWKNDNDMVHTATADPTKVQDQSLVELPAGAVAWDSGNVTQGKSWSHTFDTPGRYKYVCLPHQIANMTGEIIVEA